MEIRDVDPRRWDDLRLFGISGILSLSPSLPLSLSPSLRHSQQTLHQKRSSFPFITLPYASRICCVQKLLSKEHRENSVFTNQFRQLEHLYAAFNAANNPGANPRTTTWKREKPSCFHTCMYMRDTHTHQKIYVLYMYA